jgi:hypothetical protein
MTGRLTSPRGIPSLWQTPLGARLRRGVGHFYNGAAFVVLCFYPKPDNYRLLRGKVRRLVRVYISPGRNQLKPASIALGACARCGTSCKLAWQCFFWDKKNGGCSIYSHRPRICRVFPLDQRDIEDRNLVNRRQPCGYRFESSAPALAPSPSPSPTATATRPRR